VRHIVYRLFLHWSTLRNLLVTLLHLRGKLPHTPK
jgi:hypothetical protein